MWIAYEPDPSESYIGHRCGRRRRFNRPRRFKTAEAAMKEVDRLFPLERSKEELNQENP